MVIATILKKMLISRGFTTEKSRIKMFGKMDWTLYPSSGFAHIMQEIGNHMGPEELYRIGYEEGLMNGEEILKASGAKIKGGWISLQLVIALMDFIGYGNVQFVKNEIKSDGHHHVIIHVFNNPIVEHAKEMYGEKSHICNFIAGLFSGHGEIELGIKNAHLIEKTCICKGAQYCEFESKY
ncbi:MAG: hypothetical protein V1648_01105 [Candidatus Aenigmatarchaeota archaeon]